MKKKGALFAIDEPTVEQVGHIIKLTCGHNGKPSEVEISLINMHIEQAGFILRGASNNDLSITQIELVNAVSTPAKATKYTPIESPVTNAIRVNQKLENS